MTDSITRVGALIAEHYRTTFKTHGPSFAGVDWPKEADALLRYQLIARAMEGRPVRSVLDAGCGYGLLYEFFAGRPDLAHLAAGYRGVDAFPEMIDSARERHPGADFRVAKAEDELAGDLKSDFVVANGLFTVKGAATPDDMLEFVDATLAKLWSVAGQGMIFNLMTDLVDRRYDRCFYIHPSEVIRRFVPRFGRRFAVFHDSRLFDVFYLWAREPEGIWTAPGS